MSVRIGGWIAEGCLRMGEGRSGRPDPVFSSNALARCFDLAFHQHFMARHLHLVRILV